MAKRLCPVMTRIVPVTSLDKLKMGARTLKVWCYGSACAAWLKDPDDHTVGMCSYLEGDPFPDPNQGGEE